MPTLLEQVSHPQQKPQPASHDCSHEHSLEHWLEVYWLVEEEYHFTQGADREPALISGGVLVDIPRHAGGLPRTAKSADLHHKSTLRP
jgi:hypothetical protein